MRLWIYQLDTEGILYHDGIAMDDPATIRMFMARLDEYEPGEFRVFCQGEECRLIPEDVPYVIQDVDIQSDAVRLIFSGVSMIKTVPVSGSTKILPTSLFKTSKSAKA